MSVVFSISPPKPIDRYIYLCDRHFHTEYLKPLYETHLKNGLIVITGKEVVAYELSGTEIRCLAREKVRLPKGHRKGGQSAPRFGRIKDEMIHNYITLCYEIVERLWWKEGILGVSKIVLAGNGNKKDILYDELNEKIKQQTYKLTIEEMEEKLFEKVRIFLTSLENKINTTLEEFLEHIRMDSGKAIYGMDIVKEYMENNMLEKILIHENHRDFEVYKDYSTQIFVVKKDEKNSETFLTGYGGLTGIAYY